MALSQTGPVRDAGIMTGERHRSGSGRTDPVRDASGDAEVTGGREADLVLAEVASLLFDLHADTGRSVHLQSDLANDLGLDSLAVVELHDRLEHAFGVRLSEEVMATAATPADWLRALLAARAETGELPVGRTPVRPVRRAPGELWPEGAETLTEVLAWHVAAHPDLVSIRLLGTAADGAVGEISYGALAGEATAVATGLLDHGVARGERVAIMLPTGRQYFVVFLGILLAGGVPVPIYPPARLSVLEEHLRRQARLLDNAGAVMLVTVPEAKVAARLLRSHVGSLRTVRTPDELSQAGPHPVSLPVACASDIALIQYTSGSTGDPKGVVLTHAQLLANIRAMGRAAKVSSSDVVVSWLPLYHDMGLIGTWHVPLFFGIPLVVMSPLTFLARPASWLEAISSYGGTLSAAPNFAYQSCVERVSDAEIDGLDLSCWRVAFNGSEPVSPAVVERFVERFQRCGFRRQAMCPAYGLAEAGVGVAFTPLGQGPRIDSVERSSLQRSGRAVPVSRDDPGATTVVGCGMPLPGYEIRVVGPRGDELPDRCEGTVECRGPSTTAGYFANEVANRALWRRGWLDTGDLGYIADGQLFLTGRAKDLVIRGGRNIHPEELEQALGELDGVCRGGVAVFATADPRRGTERLVVVVETDFDSPERRAALETQVGRKAVNLLGTPPDEVVLTARGALVRTPSQKIRRAATRDAFEAGTLGQRPAPVSVQLVRFALSGVVPAGRHLRRAVVTRCFAAYVWALVGLICVPLWCVVHLSVTKRTRWRLARAAGRTLGSLAGIAVRVEGSLPPDGHPAIVVANHQSFVDSLAVLLASPCPLVFVASTDLERQKIVGSFLRRMGCVFVERDQPDQSSDAVNELEGVVSAGHRVMLFPEGSISRAPGLRAFHLGAFAVAARTGCPVVPVGIRGTRNVVRPGTYFPHRAEVAVVIGSPIMPAGSDLAAQVQLRDSTRRAIAQLSREPDVG
jgi:1-acyl-sn-glycerol-3-phosphate acyltransferase